MPLVALPIASATQREFEVVTAEARRENHDGADEQVVGHEQDEPDREERESEASRDPFLSGHGLSVLL